MPPVSIRGRSTRLPEQDLPRANGGFRSMAGDESQTNELDDVPVASDDDTTVRGEGETSDERRFGGQEAGGDVSHSPTSSIESWTSGAGRESIEAFDERATASPAASAGSAPLWAALPSPHNYLFDENEYAGHEEGEIPDGERQDTPGKGPQQETTANETRDDALARAQRADEFAGEQQHARDQLGFITSLRKRSWAGSAASDERLRSMRRQRREQDGGEKAESLGLPPMTEFLGNPWGGDEESGREGRGSRFASVAVSTPMQRPSRPSQNFEYDSDANQSGKAPTPHSVSTVASKARPRKAGSSFEERAGTRPRSLLEEAPVPPSSTYASRPSARARKPSVDIRSAPRYTGAADMDVDREDDGSSLLRTPPPNQAQGLRDAGEKRRQHRQERSLQHLLSDPVPRTEGETYGRQWCGGYAPELLGQGQAATGTGRRRRAVDGLHEYETRLRDNTGSDDDEEERGPGNERSWSSFSALPNTKAWEFKHRGRGQPGPQAEDEKGYEAEERYFEEMGRRSRSDLRSQVDGGLSARRYRTPSRDEMMDEAEEEDDDERLLDRNGMETPRTRGVGGAVGGAGKIMQTAYDGDESFVDIPTRVEDPHNERWTIHLEDAEAIFKGLSTEFIGLVRWGQEPVVPFTVFNFKYTENDAVLRHIESSVTSMVTLLTGETGFHVVPPDPDCRGSMQSRELPFVWIIRGLTAASAWELTKIRVASSKGVSMITHLRTPSNPRYVCGLVGFLRPDVEAIRKAVLGVLRSKHMLARLEDLVQGNDQLKHIAEGRRVTFVINSLQIKITVTRKGAYVANVYIVPPTDDVEGWREWVEEMRTYRFNSLLCGAGRAQRIFWLKARQGTSAVEVGEARRSKRREKVEDGGIGAWIVEIVPVRLGTDEDGELAREAEQEGSGLRWADRCAEDEEVTGRREHGGDAGGGVSERSRLFKVL
ncbi:hypothetical protein K466DRAFT_562214 [Polyporus arcularius HHB13444]|uniref:Uncharacterized protein n=1 Tax=Polyporus arcularius HHB13444 TaxID=1314778 RepID=A0A5C3PXD7_9APHY|nr:hypothetical protein K466DRAFT_562214 [Polyporus arcularius HHB13444]